MNKTCSKCKSEKPLEDFSHRNKSKGTRASVCKQCFRDYDKKHWRANPKRRSSNQVRNRERVLRNKQYLWDFLKTNPCNDCGESDPIVLEFDHINPEEKSYNLSELVRDAVSLAKIDDEIAKCIVLCANCHRRRTAIQFGWHKDIQK